MSGAVKKLAGAFAGYQIAQFVKDFALKSVSMASSVVEAQGVFDQAFAGMTDTAEVWAKELGESYHLTELAAKQSLSTFQLVLTGMNISTAKAAEMSNALVRVGADLGAAFDRSTADVVNDIRGALSGSMETMDKYGVVIRAAQVEQKALEMGLGDLEGNITQADKATATYALILEKTSAITGTTARESEGYAGQLKEAQKNIGNLTAALGEKLLPVFTKVLKAFNDWISTGDNMNTIVDYAIEGVRALGNGYFGLELVFKGTIVVIAKVIEGFTKLATPMIWMLEALAAFGLGNEKSLQSLKDLQKGAVDFTASAVEGFEVTVERIESFNASMDRSKSTAEDQTRAVVAGQKDNEAAIDATTDALDEQGDAAKEAADKAVNAAKEAEDGMYGYKTAIELAEETAVEAGDEICESVADAVGCTESATEAVDDYGTAWEQAGEKAEEAIDKAKDGGSGFNGRPIIDELPPNMSGTPTIGTPLNPDKVFGHGIGGDDVFEKDKGSPTGTPQAQSAGGTTNINVTQKVSRSDIVNIRSELDREAARQ